ncbi:holin [Helicobacter pylori]|uniref:holin n=1 Tax=Helicobacter pylori TaxID=210 RepID=UPI0035A9A3D5
MQDSLVLSYEISKFVPYILVGLVGLFVGVLYVLRSLKNEDLKSISEKVIYIIQGIGSSMLITWIGYEITDYFFNFPTSLCVSISGGVGYLGAESVGVLVVDSLKKRL